MKENDLISRQAAIDGFAKAAREKFNLSDEFGHYLEGLKDADEVVRDLPSEPSERLTDDDFETIRIHLSAYKERLCNQHRWKEAKEYQCIIDRFMAFASAQPEKRTETHACDLVSRQAAISAYKTLCQGTACKGCPFFDFKGMTDCRLLRALQKVQSAQPEIIRCKDCKYFEYDHPYIIQGIPVLGHEVCNAWGGGCKTDENGYCFMAERREDG